MFNYYFTECFYYLSYYSFCFFVSLFLCLMKYVSFIIFYSFIAAKLTFKKFLILHPFDILFINWNLAVIYSFLFTLPLFLFFILRYFISSWYQIQIQISNFYFLFFIFYFLFFYFLFFILFFIFLFFLLKWNLSFKFSSFCVFDIQLSFFEYLIWLLNFKFHFLFFIFYFLFFIFYFLFFISSYLSYFILKKQKKMLYFLILIILFFLISDLNLQIFLLSFSVYFFEIIFFLICYRKIN